MWFVVIMAGGQGTRLWPLSTPERPKPFLALAGEDTLLQQTWTRALRLVPADRILVVGDAAHESLLRDQLPDLAAGRLLLEPVGRNTAPCNALAAHHALRLDPNATLIVLSADHVITNEDEWEGAMRAAATHAERVGDLVTVGVEPGEALRRYGYMVRGEARTTVGRHTVYGVDRFVEKPPQAVLDDLLASGRALRNMGMFAWRADRLLEEVGRHQPEIAAGFDAYAPTIGRASADEALASAYEAMPACSIDHGVLQRTDRIAVVASRIRRVDVGDFSAFAQLWPLDNGDNAVRGPYTGLDGRRNIVYSDGPRVAVLGVSDLVIVAVGDALLICPRHRTQDIKALLASRTEAPAPEGTRSAPSSSRSKA